MKRCEAREKACALVKKMTLEERASQLRYDAPAIERLGVPAYNWWSEALHGIARGGVATSFPQAIGMAAMFDPELLQEIGDTVSTEGRAKYNLSSSHGDRDIYKGLTYWSPNVNIFRDPRWGRGHETYGEDPYLTSELGKAYVRGLQGSGETLKSAACAKHFAVHSGPEALRHQFDAVCSQKDLWETYLPGFEACVTEAGVEAVMGAYNRTNGEACSASKTLLQEILRDKWGFQGHILSDCWAIRDLFEGHGLCDTPAEAAAMALNAGCELNCGNTYLYMMQAYEQGLVSEDQITESAIRLFTTRFLLGIMGEGSEFDSIGIESIECRKHLELAEKATLESCVLLKNDGLLPLNLSEINTIGVIGPNANSRSSLIGNYHGTSSRYITVLEGIQDYAEDSARILYSQGCMLERDREEHLAEADDRISEAVAVAEASDVVVLVVGLDETLEGEERDEGNGDGSGDKSSLLLPDSQRRLIDAVLATGKKTVIVLMSGSSIDLESGSDKADAVLLSWYPGARGGRAIAKLLFGDNSPSGKLPVTFYRNSALDEMPDFTDYSMDNRTYRYYDGKPLYPFGFGLTYGRTKVTDIALKESKAYITAVNEGSCATQDVLQLYIHDEQSPFAPKNPNLCAFKRITLEAGEQKTVEITLPDKAFTVVNDKGERVCGSGKWMLYAGFSQPDSRSIELSGTSPVSLEIIR